MLTIQFCTRTDSNAVGACAKFYGDVFFELDSMKYFYIFYRENW